MNAVTPVKFKWFLSFCTSLILATPSSFAQLKPDFLPEDIGTPGGGIVRCFCKPGVRNKSRSKGLEVAYITRGKGELEDQGGSVSKPFTEFNNWTKFELDLKAPVINKEGFKFLLGYKFTSEGFDMKSYGNDFRSALRHLGNTNLKSSNLSAIVTKPLNEKHYLAFRFRYTANGDYSGALNFDQRFAIYKAMGVWGIKKDDDFEWGIGLNLSKSFRRTNILPFLVYNRTFFNNWGLEAAFPGYAYARYNLSPNTIFLMGAEYASDSYRANIILPDDAILDYAYNHSELLFLARCEQKIAPWVWANFRFGYQMNFSSDFEAKNFETTAFKIDPTDTPFFEIGIFISPPSGVMK